MSAFLLQGVWTVAKPTEVRILIKAVSFGSHLPFLCHPLVLLTAEHTCFDDSADDTFIETISVRFVFSFSWKWIILLIHAGGSSVNSGFPHLLHLQVVPRKQHKPHKIPRSHGVLKMILDSYNDIKHTLSSQYPEIRISQKTVKFITQRRSYEHNVHI